MGLLALFQTIWQNYFQPNAWIAAFDIWRSAYNLNYPQSKTLAKTVFFYNAVAVNLLIVNMITDSNNANSIGQANPDGEHFMICAIQMYDGANATLLATDWARGISNSLGKQGLLTINNAGSNEIQNLRLTQFIPASGDSSSGLFLLEKPIMWKGTTKLTAQITFPTAPATANYNVSMELIGMKLI